MAHAPELKSYQVPYWEAFEELDTCRGYYGMAGVPGRIPWTAICRYADKHGFAGESFDDLVTIVRAMDDGFLAHTRDQAPKPNEAGTVPTTDG